MPWLLIPWSMLRGGALRGKNLGHLKKWFSAFLLSKQFMKILGQTSVNLMTLTFVSWSEGQCDLYFTVQWFCLISWRLFYGLMSNFWIMSQYDATFDLKINVGHSDLHFMVQWFCLISWYMNVKLEILDHWPYEIHVGHWPIFHHPVILLSMFKIIW